MPLRAKITNPQFVAASKKNVRPSPGPERVANRSLDDHSIVGTSRGGVGCHFPTIDGKSNNSAESAEKAQQSQPLHDSENSAETQGSEEGCGRKS